MSCIYLTKTRKQHNFSLELASRAHTFCTVNKEKQMMTYRKNTAQRKLLGAAPQIRQGALKSNRKTCFSSSQELDVTCVHKLSPPRVEGTAAGAPPEPGGGGSGGIKLGWVSVRWRRRTVGAYASRRTAAWAIGSSGRGRHLEEDEWLRGSLDQHPTDGKCD